MSNYKIEEKIKLIELVPTSIESFINDAIQTTTIKEFTCLKCKKTNKLKIILYDKEKAFLVDDLFNKMNWLAKSDFLLKNIEQKIYCWHKENGNLFIDCLSALYIGMSCLNCQKKYICFFSYGEKQPGLDLLSIAGIWSYEIDTTQSFYTRMKRFFFPRFKL